MTGRTAPKHAFLVILALWAGLCLLAPGAALAVTVPSPNQDLYVLDQAGVLSAETAATIVNTSRSLAGATKAQVAVVTLKTLEEQSIENVSLAILRQWGLGDRQLNNGLLILVVPGERRARIEVGYGLEGRLPDAKTGRIQDEYMLPYFRQDNYDLGIRNGYAAVVQEVAQEYGVTIDLEPNPPPQEVQPFSWKSVPLWAYVLIGIVLSLLIWVDARFFNGFFIGMILGMLLRGGRSGRGSSGGGGSGGGGGSSRHW